MTEPRYCGAALFGLMLAEVKRFGMVVRYSEGSAKCLDVRVSVGRLGFGFADTLWGCQVFWTGGSLGLLGWAWLLVVGRKRRGRLEEEADRF